MRNIKLTIEYDGTNYHGWQIQGDLATIQGYIKDAIEKLTQEKVVLYGAGRTDAGVHAIAQVANFYTNSNIPAHAFAKALNTKLPRDIVIKESCEVPMDFHAQFSAKFKCYSYRIYHSKVRPAIGRQYFHWIWYELNLNDMRKAAEYLKGTHDFSSFEASNSPRKSSIRTVNYIDILTQSCYIKILIEADGFLYKMVRNIVGTLILVGKGDLQPSEIPLILKSKDRNRSGPTAPAKGLFLEYIIY